ncbi:hypothetical protein [Pannonibacter phragmitetus]|uniref:hypothetical protein n=1 Tax=Pannonibacter phragmitetus TaxID=121719 RepID=UPI000B96FFA7|nr:hypothetical protein [Pannonibacter phragmitetus]
MTLVLLAISGTILLCVLAWNFAIYALPFMVGLTAFQWAYGAEAGLLLSGLAALTSALLSIGAVIAVLGFARNPFLRLAALGVFAVPAAIAGYALIFGVTKNLVDSSLLLNVLGGLGGLVVGVAAIVNLNAIGEAALSR